MTNPSGWPYLWQSLVKDLVADPKVKNRLLVDLLNEPDSFGINWNNGVRAVSSTNEQCCHSHLKREALFNQRLCTHEPGSPPGISPCMSGQCCIWARQGAMLDMCSVVQADVKIQAVQADPAPTCLHVLEAVHDCADWLTCFAAERSSTGCTARVHDLAWSVLHACLSRQCVPANLQLGDLYLSAMDAIYDVSPETTIVIEGASASTGQYPGINWGDGFATTAAYLNLTGLTDPRPFFNTLLTKPYLNNVALGPHVYPPTITNSYVVSEPLHGTCHES